MKKLKRDNDSPLLLNMDRKIVENLSGISKIMNEMMGELFWNPDIIEFEPHLEMFQSGGDLIIEVALSGAEKQDIEIMVDLHRVTIRGVIHPSSDYNESSVFIRERDYGHFRREEYLPYGVNPSLSRATLSQGILKIKMPIDKGEEYRGLRIEIE